MARRFIERNRKTAVNNIQIEDSASVSDVTPPWDISVDTDTNSLHIVDEDKFKHVFSTEDKIVQLIESIVT